MTEDGHQFYPGNYYCSFCGSTRELAKSVVCSLALITTDDNLLRKRILRLRLVRLSRLERKDTLP